MFLFYVSGRGMRVTVSPAANISNLITFPDLLSRRVDRSGFGNRPHSSQYPEPTRPAGCVTRGTPTIGSPRAERPAFGLRLLTRWHATIRVSDIFIAPGDATRGRAACGHACGPQVTTRTTPALAETETTICTHAQPITKTRHAPLTTRRSGSACWPPVRRSSSGSILPTAQAGVSCQQGEGCERCCARIAGRKQCRHS